MNLQLHLLSRIAVVALLCLLATAAYALYQSHIQAAHGTRQIAESLGKQLESQLRLIEAGIGRGVTFPDFDPWKQSGNQPGICLSYTAHEASISRNLCNGTRPSDQDWPAAFETIYKRIFNPGEAAIRPIAFNGRIYGTLTITASAELEISDAWTKALGLLTLSTSTVFAVCLLVFLSISRALRPARIIVAGLETQESGNLDHRLPEFELREWQSIAAAINSLAASQQQLLEERQKLIVKSINLQEEERRYLARELHDEFGQCLAAINAVAASIKQTANQQCPELTTEAEHIGRITGHMLNGIKDLLGRLRPAEFDELGLAASLNSLIAGWNGRCGGKTRYGLRLHGDCASLPETQAVALLRIAQECLTNIARHAQASDVTIALSIEQTVATLTVQDDGIATRLPFADAGGLGLLGMRERVAALHGQFDLAIAEPHGLIVGVRLPLATLAESKPC